MEHAEARQAMIDACLWMNEHKLNHGTSGNISVRAGDKFLLTPSGMDYEAIRPEDILEMDYEGGYVGDRVPSTEWRFHSQILAGRPEFNAVIHTHGMYCTTLATHGLGIPAVHYMVAAAGGADIRCGGYVTPTTQALADIAVEAIADRKACLLKNHGAVVADGDLQSALKLLSLVEYLAELYWRSLQVGEPNILTDTQIGDVMALMKTYGREPDPDLRKLG